MLMRKADVDFQFSLISGPTAGSEATDVKMKRLMPEVGVHDDEDVCREQRLRFLKSQDDGA